MPSTFTSRLEGLTTSVAVKAPCRVATTAAITLSGLQTIDGVALSAGDRVLVKNQSSTIDNGIWIASVGAWTRAADFDGTLDAVGGTQAMVIAGATNANTYWRVDGVGDIDIGQDGVEFSAAFINDSASLAFVPGGTGPVATTVQAKLRQYVSINDKGNVSGGSIDATEAIQAALNDGGDIDGRGLTYLVRDTLTVAANRTRLHNLTLVGEKTDGRMLEVTGNDFVLEDFDLDGGFPEDAGSQGDAMIDGILISGALRPTVRNGAIRNFYGKTGSDFTAALGFVNCTDQQAHNIQFENIGWDNPQAYCFSIRGDYATPATGGSFSNLRMRKVNNGTHLSSCRKIGGRGVFIDGAADNGVYYTGVIEEVDLDDYFIKDAAEAVVLRAFYDSDPPNEVFVEQPKTKARLTNFTIIGATTRALALRQGGGFYCANWNIIGCQTGVTTSTTFTDGVKNSQFHGFSLIDTIGAPVSLGTTVNCDGLDFFDLYIRGVGVTSAVAIGANPNNIRFWNPVILLGGGTGTNAVAFPGTALGTRRAIVHGLYTDLATPVSYNAEDAIAVSRVSPTGGFVFDGASGSNGWRRPLWAGTHALWVDSTGVLRIKSSAPASDTDGTVVGSQS